MKIAVLSDIHGNLLALESVLDDIQNQDCKKILFLGDYALAGPEPSDTVNFCIALSQKENIEMIQGNTDKMIAEYSEDVYNTMKKGAPAMASALKQEAETLTPNQINFLANLPEQKELTIDGIKILMVHGSPRRNNEDIMPDTPLEKVEEMLQGTDADLILCGHTHIPCGFQTSNNQTVVNDGSVGRPFTENPDACYAIINTNEDGSFEVEHRFVKYDNLQASKTLAQRTFDGADKIAHMLIHPTHRHF